VSNAVKEKEMSEWTTEDKKNLIGNYGCELLVEDATYDQIHDKSFPNDTYQVKYKVNDRTQIDLCRASKRSDIFDLYYDKFGKGALVKIDWAYGRVNPKLWGYKQPDKKKRK